jgi:ACT domain-containing protein
MGTDKIMARLLGESLQRMLLEVMPTVIEGVISKFPLTSQEFISIEDAASRYHLSKRTFYNYHKRHYITLRSTEGRTFVSIIELENHIKNNPIPDSSGNPTA